MNNDAGLNELLKWSIENSDASKNAEGAGAGAGSAEGKPRTQLNPELLAQLMGGPSDADRMNEAMAAIYSDDVDLENKLIAWDNFEQLVENLDNANNMEKLGLWMPLVGKLDDPESEIRKMALWCIGTAVQNNIKSQERALAAGTIPKVVKLSTEDPDEGVRKKAARVLSSTSRNYQPALDETVKHLPSSVTGDKKYDAADMESVDSLMQSLKDHNSKTTEKAQ